jgi:hypothetical protein
MAGSAEVKREYGFLFVIIFVILAVFGSNAIIKSLFEAELALKVSIFTMGGMALIATILYSMYTKAVFNQIALFTVCFGISLGSVIFYIYDLPYQTTLACFSIPFVLVLVGMATFAKFAKEEIK